MLAHLITIFLLLILNAVLVIKLKNHDETTPGDDGGKETTAPGDDGPGDDGGKETTAPGDDGGKETTAPGDDGGKETTAPGKARNKTGMILAVSAAVFVAFAILVTKTPAGRAFSLGNRGNQLFNDTLKLANDTKKSAVNAANDTVRSAAKAVRESGARV
jgi:hypothetical protein